MELDYSLISTGKERGGQYVALQMIIRIYLSIHCGKFGGSLNSEGGFRFFTGNREAKTSDFIHFNFQI